MNGAILSTCGRYRYRLTRELGGDLYTVYARDPGVCLFVMVNPSTADAMTDDATVRKCKAFAARWSYRVLEIVNLFAWRSTDVAALLTVPDPVGGELAQAAIVSALERADRVVLAWGSHRPVAALIHVRQNEFGILLHRAMRERAIAGRPLEAGALGWNADGTPKHPLYLPLKTPFRPLQGWATSAPDLVRGAVR
jgi:hypothetical protein